MKFLKKFESIKNDINKSQFAGKSPYKDNQPDPTLLNQFILCVHKKGPITVGKKYQLHKNAYGWLFTWDNTSNIRLLLQIGDDFVERRIQARKDDDTVLFCTEDTLEEYNLRKTAENYNI
jgi:hypothetical protein